MAAHEVSPIDPKIRAEFAVAIRRAGLILDGDPVMDGMLHRVPVENGKARAKDGTYVGFTDGRPAGFIQNYLSGTRETWTTEGKELTPAEREQLAAHAQLAKLQRATDLSVQHHTAAERVQAKWDRLSDAPPREENAYLARKGVEAFGVKFNGDKLVVPARDADGKLWSLQNISGEEGGPKLFEKGGRKTGNFHLIGEPKAGEPILVAEGYATGASLHQASGRTVAIAFDSGNIDPVVGALRKQYPESPLFVMGDDDHRQKANVGVEKALNAAQKHQVGVAFPVFEVKHGLSDFNDLHAAQGLPAVRAQVEAVVGMTMEQSRVVAQAYASPALKSEDAASGLTPRLEAPVAPSTGGPTLSGETARIPSASPLDTATTQPGHADRLTKSDVVFGTAHLAQLSGAGGDTGHAIAQTVGVVDAVRVGSDLVAGKDVRAIDVGAAAASVALTAGVGGAEVQSAAQLVAGVSALDATRRTIRTLETGESVSAAEPKPQASVQLPTEALSNAVSTGLAAREAAHPQVDGNALAVSISHRNADAMAAPRNSIAVDAAAAWVAQDVSDLSQVKGDAQRADALFRMGENAQWQANYKSELMRQEPETARSSAAGYMELSAHLIAAQRDVVRPAWLQEQELTGIGSRHAEIKSGSGLLDQIPTDRIDTVAREDVLSLRRLRGDEREPTAYQLIGEALKNEVYRETFSLEMMRLPESLTLIDGDTYAAGLARRRNVEVSDPIQVAAVQRRSDDLSPVKPDALGSSVARDLVRLDVEALRATEGPWERLRIVEKMAGNATTQGAYRAELARQDPEISKSVDQFRQAGRSVEQIIRSDQLHVVGARPANAPAHDDWALPILIKGTFASERSGQLTPVAISAETFEKTLSRQERPSWENREGYFIPAASGLVGDFSKSQLDTVAALARSRGMLLEDDPAARYIRVQPPTPDRVATPTQTVAPAGNSIEQRSREEQFDDAGTAALRKRIAQSNAAVLNDPAKLGAGDRTLETLSRMTHKELEAFEQTIKRAPHQAEALLLAAQKRIEGEVELRVGRSPVPPLHERYNVVPHLMSRDYLFRDKPGTAFTEGWLTMKSAHQSPDVIKGMLDRADERGWTAVRFNGTPEFNRLGWIAATARGIKGVGHTPSDGDRAAADAERQRLGREPSPVHAATGGTITRDRVPDRAAMDGPVAPAAPGRSQNASPASERVATDLQGKVPAQAPAAAFDAPAPQRSGGGEAPVAQQVRNYLAGVGESPANVEAVATLAASKMPNDRVYVGLVTARDYAPYEFKEHAKDSPYVKLQGPDGEKTIWGVDLPRALDAAGVKLGDSIALEFRGMRAVSVPVKDVDKAGQVVGWHDETVNRNAWFAAKVDDLRAEALKPAPTPALAPAAAKEGVQQLVEAPAERKAPDRLASQPTAPPLPVVGAMPTQPPAHAPTGDGGLDRTAKGPARVATETPAVPVKAGLQGKEAEIPAFAAFDAALKQKNVPAALHEPLREIFGRELAIRQARGDGVVVNIYDPAAKREAPRTPTLVAEPKQTRGDHKISR